MINFAVNDYILALDPSYKCTGWCIGKISTGKHNILDQCVKLIDFGSIPTNSKNIGESLIQIESTIEQLIKKYNISYIVSEQSFVSNNRVTAMRLSQMHGVLMLVAAKHNLKITYYSVMTLKSKTLGKITTKKADGTKKTGEEMKKEVAAKVMEIFKDDLYDKTPTLDETDSMSALVTFILMGGEEIEKKKKKRGKK